jgi:cytolysin (calcineurin-like family phosphatase)
MKTQGISPAFTISCGDITGEAHNTVTWKSWFDDLYNSRLGSESPVQVAIGNHERHQNADGKVFSEYYPYLYRPYYYYSYNYSSVHVTILDPWNETTGWWGNIDSNQLAWLEQDLIRSQNMPYKIIALHPTPIFHGELNINLLPVVELCNKYNVDAVFFGHEHSFEYSTLNQTNYYLIGIGGNLEAVQSGFAQVDVTSQDMHIGMRWDNGTYQFLTKIIA